MRSPFLARLTAIAVVLLGADGADAAVRLLTPSVYAPGVPVLVRVEVRNADGTLDREVWDATARLDTEGGDPPSASSVTLRNGLGSTLVTFSGGSEVRLTASVGGQSDSRVLNSLAGAPVSNVGGVLPSGTTRWSGVVHVTHTVTVPPDATLNIDANTLVLVRGLASGTAGPGLIVQGSLNALGTEEQPVTITCAEPGLRWGQIRHENAAPSQYRWTLITRGGRAPGEGHTGQAPVLRAAGSTIRFEYCAITDHADADGTPGKIGFALNSDLTFEDCLFSRARMGPEIEGTALLANRTWFTDMRGPDDADGIYLHDQQPGQQIRLADCVLAGGDDDGIDTLGAAIDVERCIVRDWTNPGEDAKGLSAFHGEIRMRRTRVVNCYVGVSGKSSGPATRLRLEQCTVMGLSTGLHAAFKANATVGNIRFEVTNSIVRAPVSVRTDFGATNFAIGHSHLVETWSGSGNLVGDPGFVNEAAGNFHLDADSPCVDAGDPALPADPDGSRPDLGALPFDATRLEPVRVVLLAPASGATFTAPTNLVLKAEATSSLGPVARVVFTRNGTPLGEDFDDPYEFAWIDVPPGTHVLQAIATESGGQVATSAPVSILVGSPLQPTTNTLVASGSSWRFLDDGSDQGTAWTGLFFDDTPWREGAGQLGYGEGDEVTLVGYGPDAGGKYTTTYFRHRFHFGDDPGRVSGLILDLVRDDGAVVYLNQREIFRVGLPSGPVLYSTFANVSTDYPPEVVPLSADALLPGENLLAVEIHQANRTSSDLSFDAGLRAVLRPPANRAPVVELAEPPAGLLLDAPATIPLLATATDLDGAVTRVEFLADGTKVAEAATRPFASTWRNVPEGTYQLAAVAHDDAGQSSTSRVVQVVVSGEVAPPVLVAVHPPPGMVTNLAQLSVVFSKPVTGVDAGDLVVNGVAASTVSGSGTNYSFGFPQPAYGTVALTWAPAHGIGDRFTPPHRFDSAAPGASWEYDLLDVVPPVAAGIQPLPDAVVASGATISVVFSEPVRGVDAADLRLNSVPALDLSGSGAGPYVFRFQPPSAGPVRLAWAPGHGITDAAGNAYVGRGWGFEVDPATTGIVINEIMYHPASENIGEEFIELHNRGTTPVPLAGWRLVAGVQFAFPPDAVVEPGGYWVVAADPVAFRARHSDVSGVGGPWTGFLNNRAEAVELEDSRGRRVDRVVYADEGDWAVPRRGPLDNRHRGWVWHAEHDGSGKSLELRQPALPNDSGQNWAASTSTNGSPGHPNSVLVTQIAPLILDVRHAPPVPRAFEPVLVTARIVDETVDGLNVALFHRLDSTNPAPFDAVGMHDDGTHGDAIAGDGLYSATLPGRAPQAVVEFHVGATDAHGVSRTWPAPALPAEDGAGPAGQVVNCLYQVDDTPYAGRQPLYKFTLTEAERAELAGIPPSGDRNSDASMNATWIATDGAGTSVRYRIGVRNRGHGSRGANPPNYRAQFRSDDPWQGIAALNLNAVQVPLQHLGSVVARRAGVAGAETVAVQVRVNNVNRMPVQFGAQQFGAYAANEAINGDWAARHFPLDPNGNLYRAIRDLPPAEFSYRGENPDAYRNTWFKESNESEDDWTDLIALTRVLGATNAVPFTPGAAREVADLDQWLRHLAVMNLFGNTETGLNSGYNDDYFLYRGTRDRRFILLYYDLDQILGYGGSARPTSGILTATNRPGDGSGFAMGRILHDPELQPVYLRTLRELCEGVLAAPEFDALADQTLGDYVDPALIDNIKRWMAERRNFVLSQLPPAVPTTPPPLAILRGVPRSPTPRTSGTLAVTGDGLVAYRFRLDDAPYGDEFPLATALELSGLAEGAHVLRVVGRTAAGDWQTDDHATRVSWVVDRAWPAVRINKVMARNVASTVVAGASPDLLELLNEGSETVDLSGFRLTDDPARPGRFTFPAGTALDAGRFLVLHADAAPNPKDVHHLGFQLDQDGDGVFLLGPEPTGNLPLDSVTFGPQLPDLALGRDGTGGEWTLVQPTFGFPNRAVPLGSPRGVRILEWLAAGTPPFPDDFVEIHNPDPLPVDLGGWHLTDQPIGAPRRTTLPAHSFLAGGGYRTFIADGDGSRAGHLGFSLALRTGEIGLVAPDGTLVDQVIYGPQQPGLATGRCPDHPTRLREMTTPTPGGPNACPVLPPEPTILTLVPLAHPWNYHARTNLDAVAWTGRDFDDSGWSNGPAPLGQLTPSRPQLLPEPIRTVTPLVNGQITYYFRTRFHVPADLRIEALRLRHLVDDGAVFHLNGSELGRFNLPAGAQPITHTVLASSVNDAVFASLGTLSPAALLPGENVLAVEVHQSSTISTDLAMSVELLAVVNVPPPIARLPVLNEILALNLSHAEPDGSHPGWVELHNPGTSDLDLTGLGLTDDAASPRRWTFPSGTTVPALGFLRVRCDDATPPSASSTGFGLRASGGAVYLFHRPEEGSRLLDAIQYGVQVPDHSIGRLPDGGARWVLGAPTPAAPNLPTSLAGSGLLRINEWMALPTSGNDWIELHNPQALPVDLSDHWLSDDPNNPAKFRIPALSFIGSGPHAYQRFWAAQGPGADFTGFALRSEGEALLLSATDGGLIDALAFGVQREGISEGRLPDGASTLATFPFSASPGRPNRPSTDPSDELDSDVDGIPDGWERLYGLNPLAPDDAVLDPDGDGASNRDEYLGGTAPHDPASRLRIEHVTLDGTTRRIEFLAAAHRSYSIQHRPDAGPGPWSELATVPAQALPRRVVLFDGDTGTRRFYRLATPAQP